MSDLKKTDLTSANIRWVVWLKYPTQGPSYTDFTTYDRALKFAREALTFSSLAIDATIERVETTQCVRLEKEEGSL